jgi:hypothetical protein
MDAIENFRSEVKTGGGSGYGSPLPGVNSLIAIAVRGRICARDVGRERDVADTIKSSEEIVFLNIGFVFVYVYTERLKTDGALAEFGAGEDLGLEFVMLSEKQAFSDADLAAGPHEALPIVGLGGELASEKNFDAAAEKIAGRAIARAHSLGAGARTAAVETSGKNSRVVEDDQVPGTQQVGKVVK